jgi:tRNA dimethylallyltransferase
MSFNLITILGPTATGKTRLAAKLAYRFNGEIISADSRQVYKEMNIGTGKDLDDYKFEDKVIPYHLIDIIEPGEEFNLYQFKINFKLAFNEIHKRNKLPFLTGGTGMYLSSILQNYNLRKADFDSKEIEKLNLMSLEELKDVLLKLNSKLHNTTDLTEKDRVIRAILVARASLVDNPGVKTERKKEININSLTLGVNLPREEIKKRINERLTYRLRHGMIEEVESLIKKGTTFEKLNFFGLEYRYIGLYLDGKLNYNEMYTKLNSAICEFAKKQMTWFRKMQKEGVKIHWLDGPNYEQAVDIINKNL